MILTCPSCATRFVIEPGALGSQGRAVRCGACGHNWHQTPPPPEPEARPREAAPLGLEDVVTAPLENRPKRNYTGAIGRGIVWLLFLGVIGSVVFGAYRLRDQIVTRWPSLAGIYEFLDIDVDRKGVYPLKVPAGSITARQSRGANGVPILVISGEVVNGSSQQQKVRRMRITLLDRDTKDARPLHSWTFTPGTKILGPKKKLQFQTSIANPPAGARAVRIRFLKDEGA